MLLLAEVDVSCSKLPAHGGFMTDGRRTETRTRRLGREASTLASKLKQMGCQLERARTGSNGATQLAREGLIG